jgi:hypothetical protein
MPLRDWVKPSRPATVEDFATSRACNTGGIAGISTIAASRRFSRLRVEYPDGRRFEAGTSPAVTADEASIVWPGSCVTPLDDPAGKGWLGAEEEQEMTDLLAAAGCPPVHRDFPEAIAAAERNVSVWLCGLRSTLEVRR